MDRESATKREEHPIVSVILIALGAGISLGALRYEFGSFESPGAGFLPFFAGLSVAAFSAVTFLRTLRHGWGSLRELWAGTQWQRGVKVTISLFLYAAFLHDLGFLISTFILMTFLFRILEPSSWKGTLFAALATTLGFYLVFQVWLEAQLPQGLLAF